MFRAAILGLGNIGSRFDDDKKRTGIWSHAKAYSMVEAVRVVAGADPDSEARRLFAERRGIPATYKDYRTLLDRERPDIVSVCSPTHLHAEMAYAALDAGAKAIFCEKPIAHSLEAARKMVALCRERGVVLAVNHSRRWDRNYLWPLDLIRQGKIGTLQRIVGYYSARVYNIGTHLIDTIHMYAGGRANWVIGEFVGPAEDPDPSVGGFMRCPGNILAAIVPLNKPSDLIFELELFGTEGRLRIADNGPTLDAYQFVESPHYSDYRELKQVNWPNPLPARERLVEAIRDIVSSIGSEKAPACSGQYGLAALEVAMAYCRSAAHDGAKQILPLPDGCNPKET